MDIGPPRGPFCQSCSMPLAKPEDFGTDPQGFRINDYCHHCFANGNFTEPKITMQEMIDRCIKIMAEKGIMPEQQAKALMIQTIPMLKRWQST